MTRGGGNGVDSDGRAAAAARGRFPLGGGNDSERDDGNDEEREGRRAPLPVIAALRRGNLDECSTDVCAQLGEIPAASAGMTEV